MKKEKICALPWLDHRMQPSRQPAQTPSPGWGTIKKNLKKWCHRQVLFFVKYAGHKISQIVSEFGKWKFCTHHIEQTVSLCVNLGTVRNTGCASTRNTLPISSSFLFRHSTTFCVSRGITSACSRALWRFADLAALKKKTATASRFHNLLIYLATLGGENAEKTLPRHCRLSETQQE